MELPRSISLPEDRNQRIAELNVWIGKNIPRDPYNYDNSYFSLLNSLGYPLHFKPMGSWGSYPYTDSEENRGKMWSLLKEVQKTTGYWIVRHISEGESYKIESLMDYGDRYYYDSFEGTVITPEGRQVFNLETLQSCFVGAQDRVPSYQKDGKLSAVIKREQRAEALKATGIKAIDPERMSLQLIKPAIDKLLTENPGLRPSRP